VNAVVVPLPATTVALLVDSVEGLRAQLETCTALIAELELGMSIVQVKLNKILSEVNPRYHDEK
jgi:hypothetical protein